MSDIITNADHFVPVLAKLRAKQQTIGVYLCASFGSGAGSTAPQLRGYANLLTRRLNAIAGYGGAFISPGTLAAESYGLHYLNPTATGGSAFAGPGGGMGNCQYGTTQNAAARSGDMTVVTFTGRWLDVVYAGYNPGADLVYTVNCVPPKTGTIHTHDAGAPADGYGDTGRAYTIDCGYDGEHTVTIYGLGTATSSKGRVEGIWARTSSGRGYHAVNLSVSGTSASNVAGYSTTTSKALGVVGCRTRMDGTRLLTPDFGLFDLGGNDWASGPTSTAGLTTLRNTYFANITTIFTALATVPFPIIFLVFPRRKSDAGTYGAGIDSGADSDQFFKDGLAAAQACHPMVIGIDMTSRWGGTFAGATTAGWYSSSVAAHPSDAGHADLELGISTALGIAGSEFTAYVRDSIVIGNQIGMRSILLASPDMTWHVGDDGPDAFVETRDPSGNPVDLTAYFASPCTVTYRRSGTDDIIGAAELTSAIPTGGTTAVPGIAIPCPPTTQPGTVTVIIHLTAPDGGTESIPNELAWTVRP